LKLGSNFKLHFVPNIWVCPYLTQIWVKTTQHRLECIAPSQLWVILTCALGEKPVGLKVTQHLELTIYFCLLH